MYETRGHLLAVEHNDFASVGPTYPLLAAQEAAVSRSQTAELSTCCC